MAFPPLSDHTQGDSSAILVLSELAQKTMPVVRLGSSCPSILTPSQLLPEKSGRMLISQALLMEVSST